MKYSPVEQRSPLAVLRTTNKEPSANQIHMLEQLEQFNVRGLMVGPNGVDLSTGEILQGNGIYEAVGGAAVRATGESADALRVIKRLPASLRTSESEVPHLNHDSNFKRTVDKLEMAKQCGDLAIPTRLLLAGSIDQADATEILYQAGKEWGTLVAKPRSGQMGVGVEIGSADELVAKLPELQALEGSPNYIVQPFLDSRSAHKPYLPEELQDRPTSLRIVAGLIQLPGMAPVAEIYTAMYRYGPQADDRHHDGKTDEYYFLQREGESIERSHPELQSCFDLVKAALYREMAATTVTPNTRGIISQFGTNDVLILPPESKFGYASDSNPSIKSILMEQNSGSSRLGEGKHEPTRNAWHTGEARLLASIAHRELIDGGNV